MKTIIFILLFVVIGFIFGSSLLAVFSSFSSGFTNLSTMSGDFIGFLINCVTYIFNKPYIMTFIGVALVFCVIGFVIDFFKGGK